jgi:transposase-like protein
MTTFDPAMWLSAMEEAAVTPRNQHPAAFSREARRAIAEELLVAGWSYREISSALDVPTTTLHRWLAEDTGVGSAAAPSRAVAWIVAGIVSVALIAIFRKGRPM